MQRHRRESGFQSSANFAVNFLSRFREFFVAESWALESGIHLKESGIPLTLEIRNPSSTDKKNPESMAWNPQSKTGFPYIRQKLRPALLSLFSDKESHCWLGSWIYDQRHKPSSPFTADLRVYFSYPKWCLRGCCDCGCFTLQCRPAYLYNVRWQSA